MAGSFETRDDHKHPNLKVLRLPVGRDDMYRSAQEMVEDLGGWAIASKDDDARTLVCHRDRGFMGGKATVTIRIEGPEGIPSSEVHVKSESQGGLLSKDKANVLEFMVPFHRRVC